MKNKIKTAQYEPYNLISSSGNLLIDSGIDFFNFDVSRTLNGDFDFIDSLKVDGMNCVSPNSTNSIFDFLDGSRIFGGSFNEVSGSNCYVYGGDDNILI